MEHLKCRAKSMEPQDENKNKWVYGHYAYFNEITRGCENRDHLIIQKCGELAEIDPETLGGFTGFYDIKNTPIYENDIVEWGLPENEYENIDEGTDVVLFEQGSFWIENKPLFAFMSEDLKRIGNYFDNPELID